MPSPEAVDNAYRAAWAALRGRKRPSAHKSNNYRAFTAPPAYELSSISGVTEDAKALHNAIGIFRTDKDTLIRILPAISLDPRRMALLRETYTQLFGRKLEDDIGRYTRVEFKHAILGLIKGPVWLDVERLHDRTALGPVTVQQIFTEIILYRPSTKLKAIQEMYEQIHKKALVETTKKTCPGSTGQFLAMYLKTTQPEDGVDALDTDTIKDDVRLLHEVAWRNDKEIDQVSGIFARSSHEKLLVIMEEFESRYTIGLKDFIKKKITGDFQETLLSLLSWAEDPAEYSRSCLIKLWPIYKNRPARDTWTITHTMIWGHWNRALFEVGKMRLRYAGYSLRKELERGLIDDSYQKLMLNICDGAYGE
jgi:hypothetical protein